MAIPGSIFIKILVKPFLFLAVSGLIQAPQSIFCMAACYYPNGDLQIDDVPCNPSTNVSTCCGPGWTCLSNSVCMLSQDSSVGTHSRIGSTYRASCTDQTWKSSDCPSYCKGMYFYCAARSRDVSSFILIIDFTFGETTIYLCVFRKLILINATRLFV